jgi:energy-converting hydrogenase Eha subunit H
MKRQLSERLHDKKCTRADKKRAFQITFFFFRRGILQISIITETDTVKNEVVLHNSFCYTVINFMVELDVKLSVTISE